MKSFSRKWEKLDKINCSSLPRDSWKLKLEWKRELNLCSLGMQQLSSQALTCLLSGNAKEHKQEKSRKKRISLTLQFCFLILQTNWKKIMRETDVLIMIIILQLVFSDFVQIGMQSDKIVCSLQNSPSV